MNKHQKCLKSAFFSIFPTAQTFVEFSENSENNKTVKSIIACAAHEKIIESPHENHLITMIEAHENNLVEPGSPPPFPDIEELFDKNGPLLNKKLSIRSLTDRINKLITTCQIDLPNVTNSMLTRLKKEPADTLHKQNVLRSLAFWIGYERPELSLYLNYTFLLTLCSNNKQAANHKDGVRIGFSLSSRGDVIDNDIMNWLKKEIKAHIETSVENFLYGRWGRVKSHDLTTVYVDFPKETEFEAPAAYRHCIRSALSLSHQISIRWALSPYFSPNRFLCIGVCTGHFALLDNYLLPLLNAGLPGDPVIRVSGFARQCLLINDIRAMLCQHPFETSLFNGETFPIWWVEGFWSNVYFDFIPDLLDDDLCQSPPSKAVSVFLKSPHNTLLGIEIVKTLYYKRRFWDALDILLIILSIDSFQLNARTLRMMIFRNLALDAPSHDIAESMFEQAEKEGEFILAHCSCHVEDFYCEYAINDLARALTMVRHLRSLNGMPDDPDGLARLKYCVFTWLDKSKDIFKTGVAVSPSGIRSVYLLNSVMILTAILHADPELFENPNKPIDGKPDIVMGPSLIIQWQLGYIRDFKDLESAYEYITNQFLNRFDMYNDSISLQSYRPTIYFCHAVALWDFLPIKTVSTVRQALKRLTEAIDMARCLEKKGICIYSFTRMYGEMITASEFIRHMEASIRMIREKTDNALSTLKDSDIIEMNSQVSSLLMSLNL